MADPLQLTIELDRPDETHDLGGRVSGTVHLRASDDVEVRGLLVGPRFHVVSRGQNSGGGPDPVDLMPDGAHLRAGETRAVDFQVELPYAPPPYDGENFRVEWSIDARADVPWGRDPRAEPVAIDTRVGPHSHDAPYEHWVGAARYDLEQEETASKFIQRLKEGSCLVKLAAGCFLPMAFFGLVTFAFGLLSLFFGPPQWDLLRTGGGALLPFLLLWWVSGRLSSSKAIGDVEIELEPQVVRPGDAFRCRVTLDPSRDVTVDQATITLQARERYDTTGSAGTSTAGSSVGHTRWDTLHADERTVSGQRDVARDEAVEWEAAFQLADGVPYSLEADTAGLRWSVKIHVAATMRRDVVREKPLVVRP